MFPLLLIVIGILVLALGKRLAVLGGGGRCAARRGLAEPALAVGRSSDPALACRWARGDRVLRRRLRQGHHEHRVAGAWARLAAQRSVLAFLGSLQRRLPVCCVWLLAVAGRRRRLDPGPARPQGYKDWGDYRSGRAGRRAARHARAHRLAAGPAGHQRHADRHRAGGRRVSCSRAESSASGKRLRRCRCSLRRWRCSLPPRKLHRRLRIERGRTTPIDASKRIQANSLVLQPCVWVVVVLSLRRTRSPSHALFQARKGEIPGCAAAGYDSHSAGYRVAG